MITGVFREDIGIEIKDLILPIGSTNGKTIRSAFLGILRYMGYQKYITPRSLVRFIGKILNPTKSKILR